MRINLDELINPIRDLIFTFGLNILAAIVILIVGIWIAKLVRRMLGKSLHRKEIDKTLVTFLVNFLYFILLTAVVLAALSQLGIETTSFIAVIGAAGLAIGLALQGSLANFASGILLILFRPFRVDDFVSLADEEGFIEKIHIFTTQIKTFDNRTIVIPNATITSGKIINYTSKDIRRVDLSIGISYGDNIRKALDALTELCRSHPKVLGDPAPYVGVMEYGDSSINLTVRPWCKTGDYWDVFFKINEQMKAALDKNGITIPFPQRDVHLYEHKG
jgi:small conductance mechanosensitive channel